MGFIVILPFAALASWSIFAIFRWLKQGRYPTSWWRAFTGLAGVGVLVGVGLAFFLHYHVAKKRIDGFPIPVGMADLQENGQWLEAALPAPIRICGQVTDLLSGVALCLAPIALAAFFKENTGRDEKGRPRI